MNVNRTKQNSTPNIRWMLVGYDLIVYAVVAVILLVLYGGMDKLSTTGILQQVCLSVLCIFVARLIGKVYGQVWRYGGIQCYIRLLFTDSIAFVAYLCLELLLPVQKITFARMLSLVCLNLLGALALRMMYRYAYKCGNQETTRGKILSTLLHMFSGIEAGNEKEVQKIKVAIIGAGRVGVSLAEELLNNSEAAYIPRGFIDVNKEKVGREIHDIPVWSEDEATLQKLGEFEVQEIIFAIPSMDAEKKKALYEYYKNAGYKLKVYDYPTMYAAGGKRHLREFDIEELFSQLVLQSGAIANNGELFVLDMGQPVKIMDLAENMIRLSGVQGIEIVETGLRPGEKLYEELLVKTEELDKTDNSMIFIERDNALSKEEIYKKIDVLRDACDTGDDLIAKEALRSVVPTFKRPEDVNKEIA